MKWFQHDSDARHDSKIVDLILKYGAEGLGVYWLVVECIAAKMSSSNPTLELEETSEHLARLTNGQPDFMKIDAVLKYCVDPLQLFDYGPNNRIRCRTLLKKLDNATGKNATMKAMAEEMKRFVPSTNQVRLPTNRLTNKQTDLPGLSSPSLSQGSNSVLIAEIEAKLKDQDIATDYRTLLEKQLSGLKRKEA